MSEQNVGAVRNAIAAWRRGDLEWPQTLDPEFEWDFTAYRLPGTADRGRGRESFARFLAGYVATLGDYEQEIEEMIDAGQDVVVIVHETVRPRGSNAAVERVFAHVWTLRDLKAVKLRVFATKREALAAVERPQAGNG